MVLELQFVTKLTRGLGTPKYLTPNYLLLICVGAIIMLFFIYYYRYQNYNSKKGVYNKLIIDF